MATIVAAAGGGNWTTAGTWTGGVVPTAADDVQLSGGSGNVTITSGAVCRSLDCTGYAGTLTHTAAVTLNVGDATAGAGNIALKFVSGMTYTPLSTSTSGIAYISTSATVQTITSGGKTLSSWTVSGLGCNYQLADNNTTTSAAVVTLTRGTLDVNGQTCSWGTFNTNFSNTRTLTLGAANITIVGGAGSNAWDAITTGLTLNANTSTITMTTASNSNFSSGGKTYNNLVLNQPGASVSVIGGGTYANITRAGTATKFDGLTLAANITITGTLTLNSNSAINRLHILSNSPGVARTLNAAALVCGGVIIFIDITAAGTATWTTGASGATYFGDGGSNTGITFTTPATQTWSGTSGGNWSANAWTSRVPLPQDDVVINSAFSAGQTVTTDMLCLGKSITWTGATGGPTWSFSGGSTNPQVFGSITLISGMTISGTLSLTLAGRGTYNLASAGKQFSQAIVVACPGGTYTLTDNFSTASSLTLNFGMFSAAGFDVTCTNVASAVTTTRGLTMGSGTWTLTSTAAMSIWNVFSTALTLSGASATIVISLASTNSRTFAGAGFAYGTLTYTVAGSTGALLITGANTFSTLNFSDASNARILSLPTAGTTTILSQFNVNGTTGKLMTVHTTIVGTAATISKSGAAVSCDYLTIQDIWATGGATWYAGAHSTSVSNNTGWLFISPANAAANLALFR